MPIYVLSKIKTPPRSQRMTVFKNKKHLLGFRFKPTSKSVEEYLTATGRNAFKGTVDGILEGMSGFHITTKTGTVTHSQISVDLAEKLIFEDPKMNDSYKI